jgi:hypothetical protein
MNQPILREPTIRLSNMAFEDVAWDPIMLECGDNGAASELTPILPLIAHEDLSLPLVREPSPVLFTMEAISPPMRSRAG